MPQKRHLLREEITYSVAKDRGIRAVVAYHLNPLVNACQVADSAIWLHRSCNVCIPVTVAGLKPELQPANRVLVRLPLPYRVGEFSKPGSSDEKVRCEAGTYAWLEEKCPDIPIPRLYGFEPSSHVSLDRMLTLLIFLGHPIRSRYVRRQSRPRRGDPKIPYLLIEYIEESQGRLLSSTWNSHFYNTEPRANVFRDLSRIYLSLSKIHELKNENIPVDIERLTHNYRFRVQPNAFNDMPDFLYQASCLATMRTVSPLFFHRHLRRGPFIFSLTDLHPSNIFIDENWHVTSLVDLEYAGSLPIEMVHPPHWFTTLSVKRIVPDEYDHQSLEFMDFLAGEEERCYSLGKGELRLSSVMGTAWSMGTFWYSLALTTPSGMFNIFRNQTRPRFIHRPEDNDPKEDDRSLEFIMPWY
ncbi:hypothetical protein BJX64DRAFT_299469 [Aspergillus heterothallicus]